MGTKNIIEMNQKEIDVISGGIEWKNIPGEIYGEIHELYDNAKKWAKEDLRVSTLAFLIGIYAVAMLASIVAHYCSEREHPYHEVKKF